MGLEPTTFELEVQRANPLRHGDLMIACVQHMFIHMKNRNYCIGFYIGEVFVNVSILSNILQFDCACNVREASDCSGRPQIEITKEQIEFLRSMHFSWSDVAKLLDASVSTISRKRRKYQLNDEISQRTPISVNDLDRIVREISKTTPNLGERRLMGALRGRNIHIQRRRVQDSLRRVDPVDIVLRWRPLMYGRK